MNMKKTTITLAIAFLISFKCSAQDKNEGFYLTYNDYLTGNVKYEGEIYSVGRYGYAPFKVVFKAKDKKDHKVKNSPYWGCVNDGKSFRFYKGKSYNIILSGKITLYSLGQVEAVRDEKGIITNVYLGPETGGKRLFLHKGDNDVPVVMKQNMVSKLLEDDPEVLKEYNKGKAISTAQIFTNVAKSVQIYNSRNK